MDMDSVAVFGRYTSWKLDRQTHVISFMNGSQYMYLIEGTDRALLLDTGWGAGNLRPFVEHLTEKPLLVANTHCHPDHAGGNGEWEEVLMLPGGELDLITCVECPFDLTELPHPDYKHSLVQDGDRIDLGNRTLEVIEISAHSNGSMALLDRKNEMLFVGDELESAQVIMNPSTPVPGVEFVLDERLRRHRVNMLRLRGLLTEDTRIFPAHNGAPISQEYLDDYIALTEHIYAGDAVIEDKLNHFYAEMGDPEHRLCRVRWMRASFFVVKEELMKLYGTGL